MTGEGPLRFDALAVADIPRIPSLLPGAARLMGPALAEELRANPDTSADTPWLFCLSDTAGELVSWIRVWADRVFVHGRQAPWLWTGDLRTLESLRGRGLATELQRHGTDWVMARGIARGSVFSTDQTLRIYQRLGYLQPGYASRRVLLASGRPADSRTRHRNCGDAGERRRAPDHGSCASCAACEISPLVQGIGRGGGS